jgi:hypothetical protein
LKGHASVSFDGLLGENAAEDMLSIAQNRVFVNAKSLARSTKKPVVYRTPKREWIDEPVFEGEA